MEENKIDKQLEDIRVKEKNGEIIFLTEEGASVAKIEDIIKQPIDGLLYDLNRDYATLATMAKSSKSMRWVNDMALVNVLKYVLNENNKLKNDLEIANKELEKTVAELNEVKLEYGAFAKDPFMFSKHNYDTTPIPTASKPTVEKTNQNACKIMPGFNDQLNISL